MSSLTSPTDATFGHIPLSPMRRSISPSYHNQPSPARGQALAAQGMTRVPLNQEGKQSLENEREKRARPEPLVIRPNPERGRTVEQFNSLHVHSARRENSDRQVARSVRIQVTPPQPESWKEGRWSRVEAGSVPLPKTPWSGSSGMRTALPLTSRRIGQHNGSQM